MENNPNYLFEIITKINKLTPELIKLSGLFTAFGAFLLILYFQKIRYLPPMKLDDFTFLFVASAIFGIQLLVLLGALSLSTGYFWHLAISRPEIKKQFVDKDWKAQFSILIIWFIIPVAVLVFSFLLFAFDGYQAISIALFIITVVFVSGGFCYRRRIGGAASVGFLSILLLSVVAVASALLPWIRFADSYLTSVSELEAGLIIFFIVMVLLIGSAIAINPYDGFMVNEIQNERLRIATWFSLVSISIVIFLLVLLGGTNFTSLIAKNYGFGGISDADVVLNPEGKETVELMGFQCKQEDKSKLCILESVSVLWSRGDEYVFQLKNPTEANNKDEANGDQTFPKTWFTISRNLVLSIKIPMSDHHGI